MLELRLITQAPKAGMWSHIWGPSHLAVQRVNQLVNSGSEWTIKTLEAMEKEVSPSLVVLLTTMEGKPIFPATGLLMFKCESWTQKKRQKNSLYFNLGNTCRPWRGKLRTIHTQPGCNYLDTPTVYGASACRKWAGDKHWAPTRTEIRPR